jgi:hypothetical protein
MNIFGEEPNNKAKGRTGRGQEIAKAKVEQ